MLFYRQFSNHLLGAFVHTNCKTTLTTKIQMINEVGKKIFRKIILFYFFHNKIEIIKHRDDQITAITFFENWLMGFWYRIKINTDKNKS